MALRFVCSQIRRLVRSRHHASAGRVSRIFVLGRRAGACAVLYLITSFTYSTLSLAGTPIISEVSFKGSNADLHVAISGAGFGASPSGIPCKKCTTPYLKITDAGRGGCQLFDIVSWSDKSIVLDGFQGDPGDSVLLAITNPNSKITSIHGQLTIPNTIKIVTPKIYSVMFEGGIGRHLIMMVTGEGFGASPSGVPFSGDLPFFAFVARPFAGIRWTAGNAVDEVLLNYALWTDKKILIVGFGGAYGAQHWTVAPGENVEIAIANTRTCGLNMNLVDDALVPSSIGAIWGARLP
jgi:hypothetical protein